MVCVRVLKRYQSSLPHLQVEIGDRVLQRPTRQEVLQLYRNLLKASKEFPLYNFRQYYFRRTRDAFRENRNFTDARHQAELYSYGVTQLEVAKRQALLGKQYSTKERLAVEKD